MFRLGFLILNRTVIRDCVKKTIFKENRSKISPFHLLQIERNTSFFNKVTAEDLWRSTTSVSNAGMKRGRGRGQDRRIRKNLNYGQRIGFGKENMVWPGLTCPIYQSNTVMEVQKLPNDAKKEMKQVEKSKKSRKVHPLERGWSGRYLAGRSIGPPDPEDDVSYSNFDSILIYNEILLQMTGNFGRRRKFSSVVLTGNGKGLIGMAKATALESQLSIKKAKNKAIKKLIPIALANDYSVNHDFFCQFGSTKIFVYKKPEGHGLKCHRVIAACCKLIGIRNMAANVEGPSNNILNVVKAFIIGLTQQKTPQEIADESKLHLVEFDKCKHNYPTVLASPKECMTPEEFQASNIDYDSFIFGGKLVYKKLPNENKFESSPGYQKHLKKVQFRKNRFETEVSLKTEYGDLISHLTAKYPECRASAGKSKSKEESTE